MKIFLLSKGQNLTPFEKYYAMPLIITAAFVGPVIHGKPCTVAPLTPLIEL